MLQKKKKGIKETNYYEAFVCIHIAICKFQDNIPWQFLLIHFSISPFDGWRYSSYMKGIKFSLLLIFVPYLVVFKIAILILKAWVILPRIYCSSDMVLPLSLKAVEVFNFFFGNVYTVPDPYCYKT